MQILNPLSNDLSVMRQTLLFNAMEAIQLNVNRRNGDLKIYEFGNCYSYDPAKSRRGRARAVQPAGNGFDGHNRRRPRGFVERSIAAEHFLHATERG